jgi:hypothetical protein
VGGATSPPALLTETELLTAMDKHGIGTDATQAAHIEKVCGGRGYAEKLHDGRLAPTLFGEALVAAYESIGMVRGRMHVPPLRCAFLGSEGVHHVCACPHNPLSFCSVLFAGAHVAAHAARRHGGGLQRRGARHDAQGRGALSVPERHESGV